VIPQSELLPPSPTPGCCGPVLGRGVVGCGMQSSPVHGLLGVVGCPGLVGVGNVGCVGVGAGAQGNGRGSGPEQGSAGFGVVGCADALTARTPTRSTTMLSASSQPARQRRGRPVGGRSALASETGESIARSPLVGPAATVATGPPDRRCGRTVGGVLTAIASGPHDPFEDLHDQRRQRRQAVAPSCGLE
jgi:hypothetical protein